MTSSEKIAYFGYGSLVNLNTLRTPFLNAYKAKLKGWRRVWKTRPKTDDIIIDGMDLAFLSVEPDADTMIDGLVLTDHASSLPSLDEREALYDRKDVPAGLLMVTEPDEKSAELPDNIFLYKHKTEYGERGQPAILRSYLDAVSQGFLFHHGQEGLIAFRSTTRNFHFPILEDRDAPIYPRPVSLHEDERRIIDDLFPTNAIVPNR